MAIATTRTTLGRFFSEGARLLWESMRERELSQGKLAGLIGAKGGIVSRWLYGDTRPRWEWASKLQSVLGIPLGAWSTEPTQAFVLPAVEAANAGDVDDAPPESHDSTPERNLASGEE